MSTIVSIGTALPPHRHSQMGILSFMQKVYAVNEGDARKLKFLYSGSGIETRHSVIPDYTRPIEGWTFYPQTEGLEPFPSLEGRMAVYNREAPALSEAAVRNCLRDERSLKSVTHLITVSCTGMSAPGLDLQLMERLGLDKTVFRTSVNFMGCYAAIHALKIGDALCKGDTSARVLIVCTELCTLHFQREATMDNMASSLLFADGAAAVLLCNDEAGKEGLVIDGFYSEVNTKGKSDMAWELSSTGFLMTLSGYIPELIEEDFKAVTERALKTNGGAEGVSHWCIHPGGKRILQAIERSMGFANEQLQPSYEVLKEVGNLSSATILFVLKRMLDAKQPIPKLFGAAFGPGLTVETFTAHR